MNKLKFICAAAVLIMSAWPWYADWKYRKSIQLELATGGDLTNFPVFVYFTNDTDLKNRTSASGNDILFTDIFTNKLEYEREYFDKSSGYLAAWVKLPLLSANSSNSNLIFMYYDSGKGGTDQQTSANTWDSSFVAVHHMEETAAAHLDSTANNNDATASNTVTTDVWGKLGKADSFNRASGTSCVEFNNEIVLSGSSSFCAWVNPTFDYGTYAQFGIIVRNMPGGAERFGLDAYTDDIRFFTRFKNVAKQAESGYVHSANEWIHVYGTLDMNTLAAVVYINGRKMGQITAADPTNFRWKFWIGGHQASTPSQGFDGIIDEVRISGTARSTNWIFTSFTNQAAPLDFKTAGTQQELGVTTFTVRGTLDIQDPSSALIHISGKTNLYVTPSADGSYSASVYAGGPYIINATQKSLPASNIIYNLYKNESGINFSGRSSISVYISNANPGFNPGKISLNIKGQTEYTSKLSLGSWNNSEVPMGEYLLTPEFSGYSFIPVSRQVDTSAGNVSNIYFIMTPALYTISGYVHTENTVPCPNVAIRISGDGDELVYTDDDGAWSVQAGPGTYSVRMDQSPETWQPSSTNITLSLVSVSNIVFIKKEISIPQDNSGISFTGSRLKRFHPGKDLEFSFYKKISGTHNIKVSLNNLAGRTVEQLFSGPVSEGLHIISTGTSPGLSSGVYILKLDVTTDNKIEHYYSLLTLIH